jgi:hypothetical protein
MSVWSKNMSYKYCGKITAIVILMSFLRGFPVFGDPPTTPPMSLSENGMRRYSEYEVDTLIEDLTMAAVEAIEQAAGEAAKAASLASVEREGAAVREAARLRGENDRLRHSRAKTAIVTGVVCFFGGLAMGAGTMAIIKGN